MSDNLRSNRFSRFGLTFAARAPPSTSWKTCCAIYVGAEYLGQPSGFAIPNSAFRWGVGLGFPSRSPVRLTAELDGYKTSALRPRSPRPRWLAWMAACPR